MALVDNPDRLLKPGFFAKGVVLTQVDKNVLAVQEDAISTLAGVSTVYVIDSGKARQQQVTLGARDGKLVEVSGLKYSDPAPFDDGKSLGEALLFPTRIYVKSILKALKASNGIKALAHKIANRGDVTTPGLIMLEIDGLAAPILQRALREGYMPTLAGWVASRGG